MLIYANAAVHMLHRINDKTFLNIMCTLVFGVTGDLFFVAKISLSQFRTGAVKTFIRYSYTHHCSMQIQSDEMSIWDFYSSFLILFI